MTGIPARTAPVVVVGAGIVGASITFHLADRGCRTVLLDAGSPASGATGASFAWIGRPITSRAPSAALRFLALDEYHRLERQVPGLEVRWSGSLSWGGFGEDDGAPEIGTVGVMEPRLADPPSSARYRSGDGALDPVAVTERLVAAARDRGAEVVLGARVESLRATDAAVTGVETGHGGFGASTVVLAAGTGARLLCRSVDVDLPVEPSPVVLVRLRADPGLVRRILASDDLEVRQQADGTLLVPVEPVDGVGSQAVAALAETVRGRLAGAFSEPGDVEVLSAVVGRRPMPIDGEPILGRPPGVGGLYLAVMHSGVTLAAAAGRLAAAEILDGVLAPELAGCRVERFGRSRSR